MASACRLLLALLLLATMTRSARVSQRLVGGHAKVDGKGEEPPEEKKTLAQQVAEGKYGLIQSEIFEKKPERPGVISYEKNPEVPKDNENSLGGLGPEEIWLAEDHLLVIKGGAFHRTASEMPWPPIDNYHAPNRQVKIPSQPKVPPPFPVQLMEGGPLQFLGINVTGAFNGTFAIPGPNGAPPFFLPPPHQDPANTSAGRPPFPLPPYPPNALPENFNRGNGPGPFPYPFPQSPPPNLNQSLDEDDPSIYYPPPYSFYYPKDNTSRVPPGPLVPGIVLPPPPNFFGPLENVKTTTVAPTIMPIHMTPPPPSTLQPVVVQKPKNHYLPYENNKPKTSQSVATVPPKPNIINLHEIPYDENELTHVRPATPSPLEPTISAVPVLRIPFSENIQRARPHTSTQSPPTSSPVFRLPYDGDDQRPRTRLRPTSPPTTTPTVYFHEQYNKNGQPSKAMKPPYEPTVSSLPVIQVPRTYLRPTTVGPIISNSVSTVPVVEVSYRGNSQPTRTYLKPAPVNSATNTMSPIPVLQIPYNNQRPRTYLKPTASPPQVVRTPVSVHYLPYNSNKNKEKPTPIPPPLSQTVSTIPVLQVPYQRAPPRTKVSSTAVPLKGYFSSVDVDTNSVQPQAEYYFYEEESTPPASRDQFQYVEPTNFEKHIQQIRQKIQSYLKPSARPVYEYSFQAANYRPTKPPVRYLTTATPPHYVKHRPAPVRYQQQDPPRPVYYTKPESSSRPPYYNNPDPSSRPSYYTKQDERYLDDITKKYFTVFGQKLTTPITPPLSLAGDTIVNYRKPHPHIHPEAEYIDIRQKQRFRGQPPLDGQFVGRQPLTDLPNGVHNGQQPDGLSGGIRGGQLSGQSFNGQPGGLPSGQREGQFNGHQPAGQLSSEDLDRQQPAGQLRGQSGRPGTFISYELPGEGAHFYFLTPQLVQQQQQQQQQQKNYYYQKREDPRIPRRNQR